MQVELHPLLRCCILLHFLFHSGNGHRFQHHITIKPVHVQPALDLDVHPFFDPIHQRFSLIAWKKFIDADRAGIVGHIKGDYPGSPLFQLPVIHSKDIAFHHHCTHVQLQVPHRGGSFGDSLAEDRFAGALLLPLRSRRA